MPGCGSDDGLVVQERQWGGGVLACMCTWCGTYGCRHMHGTTVKSAALGNSYMHDARAKCHGLMVWTVCPNGDLECASCRVASAQEVGRSSR